MILSTCIALSLLFGILIGFLFSDYVRKVKDKNKLVIVKLDNGLFVLKKRLLFWLVTAYTYDCGLYFPIVFDNENALRDYLNS